MSNTQINLNHLQKNKFKFILGRMPVFEHFVTEVELPSLSIGKVNLGNPFIRVPGQGDHLEPSDLTVTFAVNEDMANYMEIYNWMVGISFPKNHPQRKALEDSDYTEESDAELIINTSAHNNNIRVKFFSVWPSDLSSLNFTNEDGEEPLKATVSFAYTLFEVSSIS